MEWKHIQPEDEFICPVCLNTLLEPTTLTCGHSVCRICVASWYLSSNPRRFECPQCRSKWEGHPQVNITLRNVIDRDPHLKQLLEQRQKDLPEDHKNTLQRFDSELQQKSKQTNDSRQNSSFFAGVIVTLIAVMLYYFLMYWGSDDTMKDRVSKPVVLWGKEDVSQWLSSMGWAQNYSGFAVDNSIEGPSLMFKDIELLAESLNISDVYHHSAFRVAVNTLRENGIKMPQSMWEYQALYPGRSLFLAYTLKDNPRLTILFLYLFYYEDTFLPFIHTTMPKEWNISLSLNYIKLPDPDLVQMLMFSVFMMVFPYGMLGLFAWSARHAHTVTHLFILATCFMQTVLEVTFFSSSIMQGNWRAIRVALMQQNILRNVGSILVFACAWPLCPYWLAKVIFVICIYLSPIQIGKQIFQALQTG